VPRPQKNFDDMWEPDLLGCWVWKGKPDKDGYGKWASRGAYVFAYVRKFGAIEEGKELDHTCRNRLCVNPDHLDVVSHAENMRRSWAHRSKKQECKRGHLFDEVNTYWTKDGKRQCRACARLRRTAYLRPGRLARRTLQVGVVEQLRLFDDEAVMDEDLRPVA
jgi:hypothetical protein